MHHMRARAILVRLLRRLLRATQQPEIPKLIPTCDGLVIDHSAASREARHDVVDKGNEQVVGVLVDDEDNALLHVGDNDARALRLQVDDQVRRDLGLAFAQELLHAQIVDAQVCADAGEEAALEGEEGEGRLLDAGLVDEFEVAAFVLEAIHVDVAGGAGAWIYGHVFARADDEEGFVVLAGEGDGREADGGFVLREIDS